jgi:hypothetical protein
MCYQREPFWMLDGLNRNINVELRPVKVPRVLPLYVLDGSYRSVTKPRKMSEWHEKLALAQHEPNAVL